MDREQTNVRLTVNGDSYTVSVEPRELLSQTLRERLGYTSINIGCESTSCGACTIHCNGKALKSCTRFTVQAEGASLRTVDDLATNGVLSQLQTAFTEEHALQCGYCTPGILMAVEAYLEENETPTREEIRTEALQGNLCRCTGYKNIVNAIDVATEALGE